MYLSQINSLTDFYCQPVATAHDLESLMDKMKPYCDSKSAPASVAVGMCCAAKYSGDDMWCRAKVMDVTGDMANVLFIDYGNTEDVNVSKIRELSDAFVALPQQARNCSLVGSVTADKLDQFIEMTLGIEVKIEGAEDMSRTTVEVYVNNEPVSVKLSSGNAAEVSSTCVHLPALVRPTEEVTGFTSSIVSPGLFYVQLASQETQLNEMVEKIQAQYTDGASNVVLQDIKVGSFCCTKFSEDEAWYRAQVQKMEGDTCTVLFIDYGNTDTVSKSVVQTLKADFTTQPPLAIECLLSGVTHVGEKWSTEATEHFEGLTMDQELKCTFVGGRKVEMKTDDGDIAEAMVTAGFATVSSGEERLKMVPMTRPDGQVTGFVSHVDEIMYVQLADEERALSELAEKLQDIFASLDDLGTEVKVGDQCCAKFSEDEAWYRAKVIEVTDGEVKVRFVDYGNCDTSAASGLKSLNEELAYIAPMAYPCVLKDVGHLGDEQQTEMTEMTTDQELLVTFLGEMEEDAYQVEVTMEAKDLAGQLSSKVEEEFVDASEKDPESQPSSKVEDEFVDASETQETVIPTTEGR